MEGSIVKLLVMDVDGTLTDGRIHIGPHGEAMKSFSVQDGLRIKQMRSVGVVTGIITGRDSEIVNRRAVEIGIVEIHKGISEKPPVLQALMAKYGLGPEQTAFVGDDENDLGCLELASHRACPANAAPRVKAVCNFVSTRFGGEGAVREYLDHLIASGLIPVPEDRF